jgi:hypothetical protein
MSPEYLHNINEATMDCNQCQQAGASMDARFYCLCLR